MVVLDRKIYGQKSGAEKGNIVQFYLQCMAGYMQWGLLHIEQVRKRAGGMRCDAKFKQTISKHDMWGYVCMCVCVCVWCLKWDAVYLPYDLM